MYIQSTRPLSAEELTYGFTEQFVSHAKTLIGLAIISTNSTGTVDGNFELDGGLGFFIGNKEILPTNFPLSLYQSSNDVPTNQRFFKLFKQQPTENEKFTLKSDGFVTDRRFIIIMLLK